ncbi:sugar phosphate isomerase/epimerase [Paenibacillus sp. J5C_2022]|uniref:sugar phosphate isomerase/epimerase family protein n=1 Tax=Paenibacillus sp. J5C2022 TaxID=2977129 RepID=UPI0021D398FF|nr:sugar phosphate isomerase/epimerase family protein [Paenibacillus sp. J5C2022]MCU6709557.1 sugar phosphate isomerase/epimerase [Paenibacillus sp. J5C2022]
MLRGLTGAGMGALSGTEELIRLAGKYGFQSVDVDALPLIEKLGEKEAAWLLEEHGVSIGSIGLSVQWRAGEAEFLKGLQRLPDQAAAARSLGCTRCCTYILPSVDSAPAHFMAIATRRLRQCAAVLGAYGISLGLEFVGPHHLRTHWRHPFIWTMEETLDWVAAIGESNVGLLLDAYHWYTTGLGTDAIRSLRAEQIVHVHINDAPDVPVEQALDNGRLYPGEGIIDLSGFLNALHDIGYRGPVAQEILTAEQPAESPEQLAQRSKAGFDSVFALAGLPY